MTKQNYFTLYSQNIASGFGCSVKKLLKLYITSLLEMVTTEAGSRMSVCVRVGIACDAFLGRKGWWEGKQYLHHLKESLCVIRRIWEKQQMVKRKRAEVYKWKI